MTISIVNHKGGTGKTTTTINLGSALASQGCSVLLVDFDAQGSLTYSLGIDEEHTIADALLGDVSIQSIIHHREGMDVIPAGTTLADVELSFAKSDDRFNHLKNNISFLQDYDFVLIDCPPSLSPLTINALVASEYVIVPMQLDVLALRGLDAMLQTIEKVSIYNPSLEVLGILPIMIDPRKNIYNEILNHIKSTYETRLFKQSIRTSVKAAEAPSFGKSVIHYAPSSTAALDYKNLSKEVFKLVHVVGQS